MLGIKNKLVALPGKGHRLPDLFFGDQHQVIHQGAHQRDGQGVGFNGTGKAIGEAVSLDDIGLGAAMKQAVEKGRSLRLHTDQTGRVRQAAQRQPNARDQTAAAHRHQADLRREGAELLEQFEAQGGLPGNHLTIVVR